MRKQWEDTVEEVIKNAGLQGEERENLRKELYSHFAQQEKDLGPNQNDQITQQALQQFGDPKSVGRQLLAVHKISNATLVIGMLSVLLLLTITDLAISRELMPLAPLITGALTFFSMYISLINPLAWIYFTFSIVLYKLIKNLNIKYLKKIRAAWTITIGAILHWLALFLSYKELPAKTFYNGIDPIAVGGFPFRVFNYPFPPMGGDLPPTNTWPVFMAHYLFWIVIAGVITCFLPKKITNNRIATFFLAIFCILLSFLSFGRLLLLFD